MSCLCVILITSHFSELNLTFQLFVQFSRESRSDCSNTNSPWAYIREGLLSEGFVSLRFGGLVFRSAYIWGVIIGILRGYVNDETNLGQLSSTCFGQQMVIKLRRLACVFRLYQNGRKSTQLEVTVHK